MEKESKILKYLILGLLFVSIVILFKFWVFKPKPLSLPQELLLLREIKIDFDTLKSQELKEFLPFEKISLPEKIGRENPFIPY
ncbi:MAG: hypothetical protein QMC93_01525 [Patescibacteria group bacterium]|nr:hypothetical protein [Patescibacteria group bacterium]